MKKTILITGAGSGIGKDVALKLASLGHIVIATVETEAQKISLEDSIKNTSIQFEIRKLDIANESERSIASEYELDVLISAAGIGETGSLAEVPMQRVRKNFETNVFSTLELIQVVLKKMMHKKQGTIIVVSSIAGRIPTSFLGPYSMTKFALSGGVAAMRDEIHQVAPDVHISLVEPGAYATGFNQRMFATKYEWMDENSYFWPIIQKLKSQDEDFKKIEEQTTQGIVKKIVKAVDAHKPHLRYVAPWYQGMYVRLLRILGK